MAMGPGSLLRSENLTVAVFSERNKDMILLRLGTLAIFPYRHIGNNLIDMFV